MNVLISSAAHLKILFVVCSKVLICFVFSLQNTYGEKCSFSFNPVSLIHIQIHTHTYKQSKSSSSCSPTLKKMLLMVCQHRFMNLMSSKLCHLEYFGKFLSKLQVAAWQIGKVVCYKFVARIVQSRCECMCTH